ncbi:glycosyltransferase family A protein [Aerococcus sp. L_4]
MAILTIFTPTYNRIKTLQRAYDSLIQQTSKDFSWLIIDDGSEDGTEKLVEKWQSEQIIEITYIKQENSGKTKSINKSLYYTTTPLWMCLDSDDYLFDDAVEIIINEYSKIADNTYICGMIGLRTFSDGEPMQGEGIPEDTTFTTQGHLRYNLGIAPEYVQVYKTQILKNYSYPEIENENYFPLSFVPDQLDQKYELLVLQDPIMVIEYQEDGITKNNLKHVINNPIGQTIFRYHQIENSVNWKVKMKGLITYNSASIISKKRLKSNSKFNNFLADITYPLGVLDYLFRIKKNIS